LTRRSLFFASNVTRFHAWRVEQLDRMGKMVKENEAALQKAIARDFKTASQEHIFETATAVTETEFQKSQLSSRIGQWRTSPGYAYVHKSIADAFVAEAKKAPLWIPKAILTTRASSAPRKLQGLRR
jgi:hypothetical protein